MDTEETILEDTTNRLRHYVTDFLHFLALSQAALFNISVLMFTKSNLCIMKTFKIKFWIFKTLRILNYCKCFIVVFIQINLHELQCIFDRKQLLSRPKTAKSIFAVCEKLKLYLWAKLKVCSQVYQYSYSVPIFQEQ